MKRRLSRVIAVVFVIACVFAFSSCKHEHVYGEWSYAVLPTCTEQGVQSRMCLECEETEKRPAEPLGHAPLSYEAKAPTCTENGNEAYVTCSRCDYTTLIEIEALGHKEVPCNGKAATCTEKGYEPYVFCERCEYRTFKEIPALGHDEIQHERKQSTCLEKGWTAYVTCSRCDYTTFKELPLSGHQQAVLAAKQPTCTETGLTFGSYCKVCNTTIKAQTVVAANGHSCKQGICTVCGTVDYTNADQYASRAAYNGLAENPRGDQLQKLYDMVYEAARRFHVDYSAAVSFRNEKSNGLISETIDISHLNILAQDIDVVHNAFEADNPIFYWYVYMPPTGYVEKNQKVNSIRITVDRDYANGTVRKQYNEQIAERVKYYAAFAEGATSEYETALRYYEAIINTVSYAYEANLNSDFEYRQQYKWTQNITGVFCKDRTVCAGYGKALSMLLSYSGIESRTVVGYTSSGAQHLWVIAKMDDGNWYWFDPTWDDSDKDENIEFRYFCVNDKQTTGWRDGYAMNVSAATGTANFLTKHYPDDSRLTSRTKNYYLPARAAEKFSSDDVLEIREPFTVDGLTFVRISVNEVALVKSVVSDWLIIPDKVTYNGMEFTVKEVSALLGNGLFDCTKPIVHVYPLNAVIPKTVDYVAPRAITSENASVNIFYEGTRDEWIKVSFASKYLAKSTIYYYSEARPENTRFQYWHYVNGVATPW